MTIVFLTHLRLSSDLVEGEMRYFFVYFWDPNQTPRGGSRICPGRHLAETSYWGIASCMIAAFDISKALDSNGKEINIPLEFTHGFVRYGFLFFLLNHNVIFHLTIFLLLSHPKPFKCSIKARSFELASLISHARAELHLQ